MSRFPSVEDYPRCGVIMDAMSLPPLHPSEFMNVKIEFPFEARCPLSTPPGMPYGGTITANVNLDWPHAIEWNALSEWFAAHRTMNLSAEEVALLAAAIIRRACNPTGIVIRLQVTSKFHLPVTIEISQ